MTDRIIPNHLRVYRDRTGKHVTLDGHELLLAEDGLFLDGVESPDDVTRVQITLQAPRITVESELHDQPAPVPAPPATLAAELRYRATLLYNGDPDGDSAAVISALADRVEAVEKENRAALNHAYDERDEALVERDKARAEVERLTASLNRQCTTVTPSVHNTDVLTASNDTLPDPANYAEEHANDRWSLPSHRTEAGYPNCSTCDGGGCPDCTDPA